MLPAGDQHKLQAKVHLMRQQIVKYPQHGHL